VEDPDGLGLAFQDGRRQLLVVDTMPRRLPRLLPDGDAHFGCNRLDPRRGVDTVASQESLADSRADVEANERLARVDPDPQSERRAAESFEVARLVDDPQRGADRPLGIVAMGRRHPEHPDDRIADELLDDAAMELDLRARSNEIPAEHPVDVLRVGAFAGRGKADEVAEQGGDDLALLGDRR
jgi:hypothetical protein